MKLAKKVKQLLGRAPKEMVKSKEFYSEYTADDGGDYVVRVYSRKEGLKRVEKGRAKSRAAACIEAANLAGRTIRALERGELS